MAVRIHLDGFDFPQFKSQLLPVCIMAIRLGQRLLYGSLLVIPPALYVYWESRRLNQAYPATFPSKSSSSTLLAPFDVRAQQVSPAETDIFHARIPLSALEKYPASDLHDSWARAFLGSPRMMLEGRIIGLGKGPGDYGVNGFHQIRNSCTER